MSLTRDYVRHELARMNRAGTETVDIIMVANRPDLAVAMVDDVPGYISDRSSERVFKLLVMAYVNAMNKKATRPMKMSAKHAFLTRALDFAKGRIR